MRILPLALAIVLSACSPPEGKRTIVASIYPLAFVAERLVGPEWEVIDLTPPGVEAHDLDLTLEQRGAIEDADLVMYLGDIGFQPQVERAVREAEGIVVDTSRSLVAGLRQDPHFWVVPIGINDIVFELRPALDQVEPDSNWLELSLPLRREVGHMHAMYNQGLEVADCRFRTIIVSHEAFGAFTPYDIHQFGLAGVTPEAEPTASRLTQARELIDSGEAGAVFYGESSDEKRTAEAFAADAGVPALPLSTLESRPIEGDYFTVMENNLASLREGLQCR